MSHHRPALAAAPVPRYTSYPTADRFHGAIGADDLFAALDAVTPDDALSLYVHIPYCQQICWYCACNTGVIGKRTRLETYVEALKAEIALIGARTRGTVRSIHFGGGSPNALAIDQLTDIIAALRTHFRADALDSIAVELDPRHCEPAFIAGLATAGVDRVSLGVQTFAPEVQRQINRIQPTELIHRVVADLRAAGIARINFDLLYGLPTQSLDDIVETIWETLRLAPQRIALFGYAHHPRLHPRQWMIDADTLPDEALRFEQSVAAYDRLVAAGYQAIGFDHFALPGDPLAIAARDGRLRRNFQGFTDDPAATVIGLGASAISQFDTLLVQNEKHVGRYREQVLAGEAASMRGVARTATDRRRAGLIEDLLCERTIGRGAIDDIDVAAALDALATGGMLCADPAGWRLSEDGRPYGRVIATLFDGYRAAALRLRAA